MGDFDNFTFHLPSVFFLELELFWQVSDGLSKKIFLRSRRAQYDYTKICKIRKTLKNVYKTVWKWWYLVINLVILRNSFFTSNQCSPGAGTFLTSLRWFVKENFSEISQSSIWLYQNMQKLKTLRMYAKYVKIVRFSHKFSDFDKFTVHIYAKVKKTLKMLQKHMKVVIFGHKFGDFEKFIFHL